MQHLTVCLVLAMGAATLATETLVSTGPGPCKSGIEIDPAFSLAAYAKAGSWDYAKGPTTASTVKYDSMTQKIVATGNSGEYKRTSTYKAKDGSTGIFAEDTTTDSGNGPLVSKSKTKESKVYFLKYDDDFAYYYICNDSGVNSGVDFRFAMSHAKLTAAQEKTIKEIDAKYKFTGTLKDFTISK